MIRAQYSTQNDLTGFLDILSLNYIKITRQGHCRPAQAELHVPYDTTQDEVSGQQRFHQFLTIRVVDTEQPPGTPPAPTDALYFVGRIDEALIEEAGGGRMWKLTARDWLAVLADNNVGSGLWWNAADNSENGFDLGARGVALSRNRTPWAPTYTGDYLKPRQGGDQTPKAGEYRWKMVWDLCINILHDAKLGLEGFANVGAPNSLPVEKNLNNQSQIPILDAIRDIAEEDPWCFTGCGAAFVDAQYINGLGGAWPEAGITPQSGIGADLQIISQTVVDVTGKTSGKVAQYFARGHGGGDIIRVSKPYFTNSSSYSTYPVDPADQVTALILNYSVTRQGTDIFSRVRTTGTGDAQFQQSDGENWHGFVLTDMEKTFNVPHGLFGIRREAPSYTWVQSGNWQYLNNTDPNSPESARARALNDSNFSQIYAGVQTQSGLAQSDGSFLNGSVTIAGPPLINKTRLQGETAILDVGALIHVQIPERGMYFTDRAVSEYTVEGRSWTWPENVTLIAISRSRRALFSEQLLSTKYQASQALSSHANHYSSPWTAIDPSLTMTFHHNLGVIPRNQPRIQAAHSTGPTLDLNKDPVPDLNNETPIHVGGLYDSGQGMHYGVFVTALTAELITFTYGTMLAYSAAWPGWLLSSSKETIIQVTIDP